MTTVSKHMRALGAAIALFFAVGLLSGCGVANVRVKPDPYAVAVATGCIDPAGRPAVPTPLKNIYTPQQWALMPPGAKAKAVEAQAGRRLSYEELDRAATAGCAVVTKVDSPKHK